MTDARLQRHPLGFYQAAQIPTADALRDYYAKTYYQQERALYRHDYPPAELEYLRLKVAQIAARIGELTGDDSPGTLLDVGCGEGFALQWFADKGWNVCGIDYSSAGMQAMNPAMMANSTFGDVFELLDQRVAAGERYDVIWLKHVLEHVTDPLALLNTLRLLCAPGGSLVVTVPNDFSSLQEHLLSTGAIDDRFWIALPDHLSYFDADSLRSAAENCGWVVRDLLADFPIDLYLLHPGSNYRRDPAAGPDAHRARIACENLLGRLPHDRVNAFYRAMAAVGLGRSLTAFLQPAEGSA